jgi:hypothetical protein
VTRRLPQPRLIPLKRAIPPRVKRYPKTVQARALSAVARRLRSHVEAGDAILVSSSVRSGSTWLFEMLASDPGVLPVFEPFHPKHNPYMAPFTDELGYLRQPGDPAAAARLGWLVEETFAGRRLTRWSASRAPRARVRRAPRTLVKEVRISRALPWLVDRWPVPTVLLVRHPCAVVESELRASPAREWLQWPERHMATVIERDLGGHMPSWLTGAARPRLLAALWALETRTALRIAHQHPTRATLVTYEQLVRGPEETVARLASSLGLDDVAPDPSRLSYMTNPRSPLRQGSVDPLSMWIDRLEPALVDEILETVHELGIRFYTKDPEPDDAALAEAIGSASPRAGT